MLKQYYKNAKTIKNIQQIITKYIHICKNIQQKLYRTAKNMQIYTTNKKTIHKKNNTQKYKIYTKQYKKYKKQINKTIYKIYTKIYNI